MGRKHCRKRRKCWLPAFSPFPTMFSKGFFFRVVKSWDYVVEFVEKITFLKKIVEKGDNDDRLEDWDPFVFDKQVLVSTGSGSWFDPSSFTGL